MPKQSARKVFNSGERREEIIEYIKWYQDKEDYAPSMREIAQYLCVSKTTVSEDMRKLKVLGLLDYQDHKARTIRLIEQQRS